MPTLNFNYKKRTLRWCKSRGVITAQTSYQVESGFSHANAILKKRRNRLNLEMRINLRLNDCPLFFVSYH
ncbi:hypothetical protein T02_1289 [Trichinella nativa]|uniref:Uncharacterized protein n=1 Tax=Trichinella nativa TaxID=6335 RepID=A0A0V1KU97_9BILA|nr:hypothetical protein T02_1289 [Trichinella nativa]